MNSSPRRTAAAELLDEKKDAKLALQEELGWVPEETTPLLCIPTGVSDQLGGKLLQDVLPGLLELPVQLLILGKGAASYGDMLTKLAKQHRERIAILSNDDKNLKTMLLASDMALYLTDPTDLPELSKALGAGAVPVSLKSESLENYDPNAERGDSFLFAHQNPWHCFAAMVRALETFRFPYDWKTIQRHCIQSAE
jgi:starch synthase